jgi:hypothetical protein
MEDVRTFLRGNVEVAHKLSEQTSLRAPARRSPSATPVAS